MILSPIVGCEELAVMLTVGLTGGIEGGIEGGREGGREGVGERGERLHKPVGML